VFLEISVLLVFNRFTCLFLPLRHIIGALLAVSLAFSLTGCSAVKLGYQNAPELAYWWLDSYLDFNDAQSLQVRTELAALQAWHRQAELPLYISALGKLQRMAPANVSAAKVCAMTDELRPRLQALLNRIEPAVVVLAPTLTAAQLEHLARQFDKRSQKWREEWLAGTPDERQARRLKRLVERAESFYGRLDETQVAVLRASVTASVFDASLSYRESQRRYRDTLQTLRQLQAGGVTPASVQAQVHVLLERSVRSPEAENRDYSDRFQQENCATLAALHNSTSHSQRRQLVDTLKDYEIDARALMTAGR
jgi:hypothetical protein